jgi:hypothetical protein
MLLHDGFMNSIIISLPLLFFPHQNILLDSIIERMARFHNCHTVCIMLIFYSILGTVCLCRFAGLMYTLDSVQ